MNLQNTNTLNNLMCIILQDIPVDVLRPRRIPPDVPDVCKVRVDHDEGIISPG